MKRTMSFVLFACVLVASTFSDLPNVFGEPLDTISLAEGFTPDPVEHRMTAGGGTWFDADRDLSSDYFSRRLEVSVSGWIYGPGPDVSFYFETTGESDLYFSFAAETSADTFLLINDPDGDWWVMDDNDDGLDPAFGITSPPSGRYDIWVGTWAEDSVTGTLFISELGYF